MKVVDCRHLSQRGEIMKQKTWELYSQILSQEGIRLEYSDYADTAFFNLETRVVTIPTFEYMTDDVTQLLVLLQIVSM